ncbi:MAG: Protein often near L-alanine-DL-glutamate epimerase (cell wall recycling), partial [uncultured Rubrobacteraceae bacterium]
ERAGAAPPLRRPRRRLVRQPPREDRARPDPLRRGRGSLRHRLDPGGPARLRRDGEPLGARAGRNSYRREPPGGPGSPSHLHPRRPRPARRAAAGAVGADAAGGGRPRDRDRQRPPPAPRPRVPRREGLGRPRAAGGRPALLGGGLRRRAGGRPRGRDEQRHRQDDGGPGDSAGRLEEGREIGVRPDGPDGGGDRRLGHLHRRRRLRFRRRGLREARAAGGGEDRARARLDPGGGSGLHSPPCLLRSYHGPPPWLLPGLPDPLRGRPGPRRRALPGRPLPEPGGHRPSLRRASRPGETGPRCRRQRQHEQPRRCGGRSLAAPRLASDGAPRRRPRARGRRADTRRATRRPKDPRRELV